MGFVTSRYQNSFMKSIIEKSLSQSYSYTEYRNQVKTLLKEGKSSGNEQSEALTHYSELNEARMNRLEKTVKISKITFCSRSILGFIRLLIERSFIIYNN